MMCRSRLRFTLLTIWVGATAAWSGNSRLKGARLRSLTPVRQNVFSQAPTRNALCSFGLGLPMGPSLRSLELRVQATADEATQPHSVLLADPFHKLKQRIINGIFLAVSFGYALYTILNIDHGMTRGWSHEEMLLRIPVDNWNNYETSLAEKPIFTKTLINVIIYLLGDWLSQTLFQKKNVLDFDIMRTVRNGFIGLCFGPLVHQYYEWSDYILPVEGGIWNRAEKILMDQTIYLVVKCSIYICAVGLLKGESWEDVKQTVQERIVGIVFTAWKFWPLVHCITYGLIPARHRILWVNSVDLIWNAILATKAQRPEPEPEPLAIANSAVNEGFVGVSLFGSTDAPLLLKEHVIGDEETLLTTFSAAQIDVEKSFFGHDEIEPDVALLSRNSTPPVDSAVSTLSSH